MSRFYPYRHLQQPAPLQGLPLHILVNGIDLRNSGGLRCWLRLFSVQLCNYAVKSGYQGFIQGPWDTVFPRLECARSINCRLAPRGVVFEGAL